MLSKIKFIVVTTFVLLIFAGAVNAKNLIEVKDTIIPHGKTYLIPVYGEIDAPGAKKLTVYFNYNGIILDIKSAKGGDNTGFHEAAPAFDTKAQKWDSVNINVSSSNFDKTYKGVICYLEIEALVGSDSIAALQPYALVVDDVVDPNAEFKSGIINVGNPTVIQKYPEGIGFCYPNPNMWVATFNFNVQNESKVTFKIYNSVGVLVQTIPAEDDKIKFNIFNANSEKIPNPVDYLFKQGAYKLTLDLSSYPLGAGSIYILMETKTGSYKTNFIYIK